MLNVKDDWDKVKIGDRVRFPAGYGEAFEATVTKRGRRGGGNVDGAAFEDNVTYKLDGTPRKNSAKVRRDQFLYGSRLFEIIKPAPVNPPATAGELTDAHIGMVFKFHGHPTIEGVFIRAVEDSDDILKIYVGDAKDDSAEHWAEHGYYIDKTASLTYLGGSLKDLQERVDIDTKLAAYFNQELDRALKTSPGSHAAAKANYGETIVKILKTLTE